MRQRKRTLILFSLGIKRSQLDAIAIRRGPGAFTGVCLAMAIGQGIALAFDKPVVAVSLLQATAVESAYLRNNVALTQAEQVAIRAAKHTQ